MTEIEHGGSPEVAAGSEGKDTAPRHVLIREKATEEDQAEAPSPERDSFTARISCSTDSAGSSTTESEHLSGFSGLLEDAITEDHYMELRSAVGLHKGRVWRMTADQWGELQPLTSTGHEELYRSSKDLMDSRTSQYQDNIVFHNNGRGRSILGLPVMSPSCTFVSAWSWFIMFFDLIYTAFLVPVSVGFKTDNMSGQTTSGSIVKWIDFVAGFVFMVAILLGFHIGFVAQRNLQQVVILDGKWVAKYYYKESTLTIDLMSSLIYIAQMSAIVATTVNPDLQGGMGTPTYWVVSSLQLLRMVRLIALFKVMQRLLVRAAVKSPSVSNSWLTAGMLYFMLIFYLMMWVINAAGCVWFYVGSWYSDFNDVNWVAARIGTEDGCYMVNYTWRAYDPDGSGCDVPNLKFGHAYALSIYWSVTTMATVGYGDISPTNIGEIFTAIVVMLMGIMIFAILISSMQEIFATASTDAVHAVALRSKLAGVDRWIEKRCLPRDIRCQIRRYYHEAWLQNREAGREQEIFLDLPEELQGIVAMHLTDGILRKTRVLKDLSDDCLQLLASKLIPVVIGIGQDICRQGEIADRIWVLQSGHMAALYGQESKEVEEAPALIGDTTILQVEHPEFEIRPCGYRAITPCELWELTLRDLCLVFRLHPKAQQMIRDGVVLHLLQRAGILCSSGVVNTALIQQLVDEQQARQPETNERKVSDVAAESQQVNIGGGSSAGIVHFATVHMEGGQTTDESHDASRDQQEELRDVSLHDLMSLMQDMHARVRTIDHRLADVERYRSFAQMGQRMLPRFPGRGLELSSKRMSRSRLPSAAQSRWESGQGSPSRRVRTKSSMSLGKDRNGTEND